MRDDLVSGWAAAEAAEGVLPLDRSFRRGAAGAARAVLLLHGGGATPADLIELADVLAGDGFACCAPLLPAHGRGPAAMGGWTFDGSVARCVAAFDALAGGDGGAGAGGERPVAIVAQSLGAVVAVRVAIERPVAAFVALAPALRPRVGRRVFALVPMLLAQPALAWAAWRWQMEAGRGIRATRRLVGDVRCPLLVLHSDDDESVELAGARELVEGAGSSAKELVHLTGQGHVLSRAPGRRGVVFPRVREFLGRWCGDGSGS